MTTASSSSNAVQVVDAGEVGPTPPPPLKKESDLLLDDKVGRPWFNFAVDGVTLMYDDGVLLKKTYTKQ